MKKHPYRISEAALGRIYAELISLARAGEITAGQMHDTMCAVFSYIESGAAPACNSAINPDVWERLKTQIDKSARRSASARARAARRKDESPTLTAVPAQTPEPVDVQTTTVATAPEAAPEAPVIPSQAGNRKRNQHHSPMTAGHTKTQRPVKFKKVKITSLRNNHKSRRRWA